MTEEAGRNQEATAAAQDAPLPTDAATIVVTTLKTPPGISDGRGSIPKAVIVMYIK
jgi:hypothetical protein